MAIRGKLLAQNEIAQTPEIDEFHSVNETAYRVVVLTRPEEGKSELRDTFLKNARREDGKKAGHILKGTIGENGAVNMDIPVAFEDVREELESMATSYHKMSGITDFKAEISNLATLDWHRHPYPTLNCVWGDTGTAFAGEEERQYGVQEGDLAYFKENVVHRATNSGVEDRVTVVFQPQNIREYVQQQREADHDGATFE